MSTEEIPYQLAPQVEALKQERANCVAYGNETRVAQIDKQLEEFGVKVEAAEERKAAAKETSGEPKKAAPAGRSSKPQQTVAGDK